MKKIKKKYLFMFVLLISLTAYYFYINREEKFNFEGKFKLTSQILKNEILIEGDLYKYIQHELSSRKYNKGRGATGLSDIWIEISNENYYIFDDEVVLQRNPKLIIWNIPGIKDKILTKYQNEIIQFPPPTDLK